MKTTAASDLCRIGRLALMFAVLAGTALALVPEPPNLSVVKAAIRAYVGSGEYERGVAAVAAEASAWIENRVRVQPRNAAGPNGPVEKLAVVIDLDETLFCNASEILAHDFAYDAAGWEAWVAAANAPAFAPVRDFYQTARRLGVAVIFLTSRPERQRAATDKNLRAIGCAEYAALVCAPDSSTAASGPFKLAERRRLKGEGFVIIANLGDQPSDFLGGVAERDFKLPNPFYMTE